MFCWYIYYSASQGIDNFLILTPSKYQLLNITHHCRINTFMIYQTESIK